MAFIHQSVTSKELNKLEFWTIKCLQYFKHTLKVVEELYYESFLSLGHC